MCYCLMACLFYVFVCVLVVWFLIDCGLFLFYVFVGLRAICVLLLIGFVFAFLLFV